VQRQSIPRRLRLAGGLCLAAALAGGAVAPAGLRETPAFLALFAPRLHREAYRAFVSPLPLDAVLRQLADDPDTIPAPGSWQPKATLPFDAFGEAGTYDRFAVARLYGATRVMVARGARGADGVVSEAWTLLSPYPASDLSRLERGTLVIVLRVPGQP
jgi:hypothetical protein